jgi:hypothetical protein
MRAWSSRSRVEDTVPIALAARACQIYLPTTVADPTLELYAVLRS